MQKSAFFDFLKGRFFLRRIRALSLKIRGKIFLYYVAKMRRDVIE